MLLALGISTSIVGFYGGGFAFGCALGEMTTTNRNREVNSLLGLGFVLEAIPLGWLSYAYFFANH